MIGSATKRTTLRAIHLVLSIPILGYIYGEPSQVQQYAGAARFVFVPVIILSGFWMYAGVFFAIIGVAVWLGAYYLSGVGAAILSQVALFIARKTWLVIRARRSKSSGPFMQCSQLAKALGVVDLYRSAAEATRGFFVHLS
jgi:hypothetical protein